MQVEVKIDSTCTEPKIVVHTDRITDEIAELIKKLSLDSPQILTGFKDGCLKVLEPSLIYRFYASDGKVFARTENDEYTMRQRLYELEERLDNNMFVRISSSEIINIRKVISFDLSFTGTICVSLSNGTVTYVSRRYVSKLKKILGL